MPPLYPYAVAVGGVLGLLGVWLVVQRLWARTFAVDGDVLAVRADCGGCAHAGHCAATDLCAGLIDTVAVGAPPPRDKAG